MDVHLNMDDRLTLTPAQVHAIDTSGCCMGVAVYGAHRCTCWVPVYDPPDQAPLAVAVAGTRTEMCHDCAYRPDSPERTGDPEQKASEPGELDAIAADGVFWCHQGIRRPVAWRHPTLGIETTKPGVSYDPPLVGSTPYRADGTPAERCAGWAARRRQLGVA